MASKTSDLATETAEDVRSGVRPALIDAAGAAAPQLTFATPEDEGALTIKVVNAGPGPALNVYAYAFAASQAFARRTRTKIVGNVAPEATAQIVLGNVPNVDPTGSIESYLAIRVVCVYSDLAGRQYHTVIRLSDPGKGRRSLIEEGDYDDAISESLTQDGTEVGEGEAPPPQWRRELFGRRIVG